VQQPSSFQVYNASAGSGKTFTLVKEYLKILLLSDNFFLFQKILAITFTNKAAGEMKDRILKSLVEFTKGEAENSIDSMFFLMLQETNLDSATLQKKSKTILQNILQNYSAFHIKTIDSFTNRLIKSFAFDLGLPLDFEVELDGKSILEETIDIIISKIGIDKDLTNVLVEFAKQKTLEDKSWDISRELKEISLLLLSENDASEIQKLESKTINDFKVLEKKLRKVQKEAEKQFGDIGEKGLQIIDSFGIAHDSFSSSDLPNFFKKLIKFKYLKTSDLKFEGRLFNAIENETLYSKSNKKLSFEIKNKIESVADEVIQLYRDAEKLYDAKFALYQLHNLLLKNLIPLAIINSISQVLEEIKTDNNIRLNSEFNQIISKHLREQPAAFIYEKIGEKFKHFFIDEMQDTSVLQWENLIPLLNNALSEEDSSLLLVGDAKQAIYRWRGGEAEQFINLSKEENTSQNNPFLVDKKAKNLDTNFRSYSEIINFNNQFFTHISKYFQEAAYQDLYKIGNDQQNNKKKGGFVSLNFLEDCKNVEARDILFPEKVYETIISLDDQFDRNEICVLVRKKTQGIAIAKYLSERNIAIVSSETLLVKNNEKVDFIIQLLTYLEEEKNDEAKFNIVYFLYHHLHLKMDKHQFISELLTKQGREFFKALEIHQIYFSAENHSQSPFYESIEQIIRSFRLTQESDAYLQFFLDFVFDFTQRKSQNNLVFVEFWEQKKDNLSIVASNNQNAVQIMTVHKSKGLEFPVVIFPYDLDIYYQKEPKAWYNELDAEYYNNFESILIPSSSSIETIGIKGKKIFKEQQEKLELDNFNLLYVALTRAKEQLYIVSEIKNTNNSLKFYSQFFMEFLKNIGRYEEGRLTYTFGQNKRMTQKNGELSNIEIQQDFISSSWQDHEIHIVANSDLLWDNDRGEAILFGNVIHEMMSKIFTEKDVKIIVSQYVVKGVLDKKNKSKVEKIILSLVNNEKLKSHFEKDKNVFTEREIITEEKHILIPDRLIFDNNNVSIIDYKTGKPEKKHVIQVENYATVLKQMNFRVTEKLLVYIDEKIEVIEV